MKDRNLKREAFINSARVYLHAKKALGTIDAEKSAVNRLETEYIKEDLQYTESILQRIKEELPEEAYPLMWKLYIEGKTQTEAAEETGITRRQLQYSIEKWMTKLFD